MEPYIFILIINLILSYIANINYDKKFKFASVLSISILVLVNVIFSGCRDFGVGIDTNVYIESYFNATADLQSLKASWSVEGFDKGFLLLAYVSNQFSDDAQSLLVVTSLFIQAFFYLALWQYKKVFNISIFVATLLFCIIFYCHTLNLMRQFCAISLLAYAFSLYIQGNRKTYLLLQVLAYFFHSTSVIFVFVPLIWELSNMKNDKKRNMYALFIVIGLLLFISSFFYFASLLGDWSLLSEVYADRYGKTGGFQVGIRAIGGTGFGTIFSFVYPIAFILYAKYVKSIDKKNFFFILMLCLCSSILQLLSYQVKFIDRIAFYLSFIMFIFLPKIFSSKKMNISIKAIVILLYISNWYNIYIIGHGGDIYPYTSVLLNIK